MYGPPYDCKRKAEGEEKQPASMYPAFGWRSTLLAMMSFARACSYKPNGRKRPLCLADFRHAVVTVLSSLPLLCRLRWVNFKRRRGAVNWEREALVHRIEPGSDRCSVALDP
jgi:hypothetical protein